MMPCLWDYDAEHDILFVSLARKSCESVELQDGVIADLDKDGDLVALELFDASELFAALGHSDATKGYLAGVSSASVSFRRWKNYLILELEMRGERTLREKLTIPANELKSALLEALT